MEDLKKYKINIEGTFNILQEVVAESEDEALEIVMNDLRNAVTSYDIEEKSVSEIE